MRGVELVLGSMGQEQMLLWSERISTIYRQYRDLLVVALTVLFALTLNPSPAHAFNPDIRWRTLTTPHFYIHYPHDFAGQALHVARAAEWAYTTLSHELDWPPPGENMRVDIVVNDDQDFAQGFAQTIPYRRVTINLSPPGPLDALSQYDDWLAGLVIHELAHIFHIDTVGPIPNILNRIFGKQITPNGAQARWFVEGLATHFESNLSSAGRVRSRYVAGILRTQAWAHRLPTLSELGGAPTRWPGGSMSYLYGGRFLSYLRQRFESPTKKRPLLAEISHDYAARLFPWAMNLSVSRATGYDYAGIYKDFSAELETEAQNMQRAILDFGGRSDEQSSWQGKKLTALGGRMGGARVDIDGTLLFLCNPVDGAADLCALKDGNVRSVRRSAGNAFVALDYKHHRAVLSELEVGDVYHLYRDLYSVDIDTGENRTRLTHGARVSEPDISKDGQKIVFVQTHGVHRVLRSADFPTFDNTRTLADLGPLTQIWSPRFSPDAKTVVFVGHRNGRRNLFMVKLPTTQTQTQTSTQSYCNNFGTQNTCLFLPIPIRPIPSSQSPLEHSLTSTHKTLELRTPYPIEQLTDTPAFEGGPSFSPDGKSVLYHSDHTGIFNIYSLDLQTKQAALLSMVLGGAFDPVQTPDGRVIFRTLGAEGFDLAELAAAHVEQAQDSQAEQIHVLPQINPFLSPHPPQTPAAMLDRFPITDYSPWRTLMPRTWTPVLRSDIIGTTVGAAMAAEDATGRHRYAIEFSYGIDSKVPTLSLEYRNDQFFPGISISAAHFLGYSNIPVRVGNNSRSLLERNIQVSAGTDWPLWATRQISLNLNTSWNLRYRRALGPQNLPTYNIDPFGRGLQFPDQGRFATLNMFFSLSDLQRYSRSISRAKGFTLSAGLQFEDPMVGSEYSAMTFRANASAYLPMPWSSRPPQGYTDAGLEQHNLSHHTLALRASFGFGRSNYNKRKLFVVSGLGLEDPLLQLLGYSFFGTGQLRGFPLTTLTGDAKLAGNIEYRFPIYRPQRGIGTMPVYAEYIAGAVFFDFAGVAKTPRTLLIRADGNNNLQATTGLELRTQLYFGYGLPVTARLGWGYVLTADLSPKNQHRFYLNLGYPF